MDKKQTSRLLENLIFYNRRDIENITKTSPELSAAFFSLVKAIDEEYGSGDFNPNTSKVEPKTSNYDFMSIKDLAYLFLDKFIYYINTPTVEYVKEVIPLSNDTANFLIDTFRDGRGAGKISSNTVINFEKSELINILEGGGDRKLFILKVGDKVKLPKTKGVGGSYSNLKDKAIKDGQDYMVIREIYKYDPLQLYLTLNLEENKTDADFFSMSDVEPYEAESKEENNSTEIEIEQAVPITSDDIKIGDLYKSRANILEVTRLDTSGKYSNYVIYKYKIKNSKKSRDNKSYAISKNQVVVNINNGDWVKVDSEKEVVEIPTFKVGEIYNDKNINGYTYEIIRIISKNQAEVKIVNTNSTSQVTFRKMAIPLINNMIKKGRLFIDQPITTPNQEPLEKQLPNTDLSQIKWITTWRPEWKAQGDRPSPTRKAAREAEGAIGLGNDGVIYVARKDSRDVNKWVKTALTPATAWGQFIEFDKNMLIDQLTYENTQLDVNSQDYKDNLNLIEKIKNGR